MDLNETRHVERHLCGKFCSRAFLCKVNLTDLSDLIEIKGNSCQNLNFAGADYIRM